MDHAPHYYQKVPLEISFYYEDGTIEKQTATLSGPCSSYSVHLPLKPIFTGLDLDEKISDAVTASLLSIKTSGVVVATYGKMSLNVSAVNDSALLRIEHVYAGPDPFKASIPNLHISQERFWKVDGIFTDTFDASATVNYNGTTAGGGFLDNQLITNSEDSLRVLYRSSVASDWQIETDVIQNFQNSHADKKGSFTINHLKKGEYTFGIFDHDKVDSVIAIPDSCLLAGVASLTNAFESGVNVFPNPADEFVTLQMQPILLRGLIEICNLYGVHLYQHKIDGGEQMISISEWNPGVYLLKVWNEKHQLVSIQKIIVN